MKDKTKIKIKICGLRSEEDVSIVNEYLPDYIGFVFVKGRKRYIDPADALSLKQKLDKSIRTVGVFIDEDVKSVYDLLRNGTIDIAQLHGSEDEDYIDELSALIGARDDIKIIKAFQVSDASDIDKVNVSGADMVILDSGTGSGKTFDWSILKDVKRDFFLAGGLDPDNVKEATDNIHPFGVDVSSGVETEGKKDIIKVEAFIKAVRKEEKDG